MVVKANAIPLQHRKLGVVVSTIFFVTKRFIDLINTTTARCQKALHMEFWTGHKEQLTAISVTRANKLGLESMQMNVSHGRVAHRWRVHFHHLSLCKELTNGGD